MLILHRNINLLLIIVVLSSFVPVSVISVSVRAAVVNSQMVADDGTEMTPRQTDELKVRRALEHKLVSERLKSAGLSQEQIDEKISRMSDEEVHKLASLSDRVPAGGHAGVLVSALALVAAVFLVIYILERRT